MFLWKYAERLMADIETKVISNTGRCTVKIDRFFTKRVHTLCMPLRVLSNWREK